MPCIEHSICPAYLSEPISGMQCPLVSDPENKHFLGTFAVRSGACTVQTLQPIG